MESISENELKRIEELTEVLRNKRQRIWMDEYKPFGYEILDIRFAGVAVRAKSAANRLTQYIRGEIDCIPEVEEKYCHIKQLKCWKKNYCMDIICGSKLSQLEILTEFNAHLQIKDKSFHFLIEIIIFSKAPVRSFYLRESRCESRLIGYKFGKNDGEIVAVVQSIKSVLK